MKKKLSGSKKEEIKTLKTKYDFFKSNRNLIILLAVFCLLIYGNSIRNKYSLDDIYVTNNEQVKGGFSAIPEILTSFYATNVYEDGQQLRFGYRPVVKTTFAIEYAIFKNNPHVSHFINLLLYFFLCLIVFNFLKRIFKNQHPIVPFLVVLLFAANPLHTEVVDSLKNRDELLSALFGFLSLNQFMKFTDQKKWQHLVFGFLLFILAYYSKMSAMAFIALIPLSVHFFSDVKFKYVLLSLGILFGAFVSIRLFNRSFLPDSFRPKQYIENPIIFISIKERIPTAFSILLFYLKKILFPSTLLFYYGYNTIEIVSWGNASVIISVLIHLVLLVFGIVGLKKKRIWAYIILTYLVIMAMYSNILKPPMGIVADRFLFVAVLPFSMSLVCFLIFLKEQNNFLRKYVFAIILIPLMLFYTIRTIDRNKDWYDQKTLVKHDIDKLEKSARANYIYAGMLKAELNEYVSVNKVKPPQYRINEIKKYLDRAIAVYPDFHKAWAMLGTTYFVLERNDKKGIACYEKAISIKRNYLAPYQNLAYLYKTQEDYLKSIEILEKAYQIRATDPTILSDLVEVYRLMGNDEKAGFYKKKLEELN